MGHAGKLYQQIAEIEQRLLAWMQPDQACKTIDEIPGAGLLTAMAAAATKGDVKAFRSGREFAASLGLGGVSLRIPLRSARSTCNKTEYLTVA